MENLRLNALALHLGVDVEELNVSSYDDNVIEYGSQEYLVVTDSEADDLWDEELDNYLEECIYPELPDSMRNYFDSEKWKSDARFDGRAHSLARYDGNEDEIKVFEFIDARENLLYSTYELSFIEDVDTLLVDCETFYIYRQN